MNNNIKNVKSSEKVQQHHQSGTAFHSSVDGEQHFNQDPDYVYNGLHDPKRLNHLVNKQLVLPIIAFPNSSSNDSNHLIKPSEYLKSIVSDNARRSSPGSVR